MTATDAGVGRSEYAAWCALLDIEPRDTLSPIERAKHLPRWINGELIATDDARARLTAWIAAGRPEPRATDVALRLGCFAAGATLALVRQALTSGAIPPPVVWFALERVSVIMIGRDCRGLALPTPSGTIERVIVLLDAVEDPELISTFKHELAHCWLLPIPRRDLSHEEQALVMTADVWRTADRLGLFAEMQRQAAIDERQACGLARVWGATGPAADEAMCMRSIRNLANREAAR
jgi:hypothetical protein